uniref:Uncharacterized protein n=1 Tax=Arundo donax TaxID=35708 RepID=A0A0A9EV04_ARUDO
MGARSWGWVAIEASFATQEFHRNGTGISQESVQFHRKNTGFRKFSCNPNEA